MRFVTGILFATVCWLGLARPVASQVYETTYRPPEADYRERDSEHFRIIYDEGLDAEAEEAAAVLEWSLPLARDLVGLRRALRLPVVLNRFNDRSNGYVTPLPFRQEIEGIRLRGQALSPRTPSWMVSVLPHELTHAAHAQSGRGVGVGWAIRPFAPDLSRALNFGAPSGFSEGVAVYLESSLHPGWGRLDYSLFTMQFRAKMLSDDPWSLTQLLEDPAYTRPLDRHYYGGYLFEYMAAQDRLGFFGRTRDAFYRVPVFGFGLPLWYGTGQPPHVLGRRLRRHYRAQFREEIDVLGPLTQPHVVSSARGLIQRRPRWLDDGTLSVYTSGYDVRPGFYRVDAATGRRTPIGAHRITEDYFYHYGADTSRVLFARYVVDPLAAIKAISEVYTLDLVSGDADRLTTGGRLTAPVPAPDGGIWALQHDGQFNHWVHVAPGGQLRRLTDFDRSYFVSLAPAPAGSDVAVLLNVAGHQGIFRATIGADGRPVLTPRVLFADASVYDLDWSPDGRYLLFSADPGGIANVYALDVAREVVLRLTNVPFGALEPTVSPDGTSLAYIDYQDERFDLVRLPFAPEAGAIVPPDAYDDGRRIPWQAWLEDPRVDALQAAVPLSEARPYRPGPYLAPRMVAPVVRYDDVETAPPGVDLGLGLGVAVQGVDPLETWSYGAEAFYQDDRLWGDVRLATATSVLRPALQLYDLPSTVNVLGDGGVFRAGREERGASLLLSLPVTLSSNVYRSQVQLALETGYRQDRLFAGDGTTLRAFRDRFTLRPAVLMTYRLQGNLRDLVPNSGLLVTARATVDAWAEDVEPERWFNGRVDLFLPLLAHVNGGVRVYGSLLAHNQGSLLDLDNFVPHGFSDAHLGRGTFLRYGTEYVQPVWFIDDGFLLVPLYFQALFGYAFAERLNPVGARSEGDHMTAFGGGVGLQFRLFHLLDLELRVGAAYRVEAGDWVITYR